MRRGTWPGALVLLMAAPGLVGCTDDGGSDPGTPSGQSEEQVAVEARVTRVAGRLPPNRRRRLEEQVGQVVEDYVTAAFLGPSAGEDVFPGFTEGARRRAMQDRDVLAGHDLPGDDVGVQRATAYLAVLAPRYRPKGATARLELDLAVPTDDGTSTVQVRGRLLLTPTQHGWRIFGYDLSRGDPR